LFSDGTESQPSASVNLLLKVLLICFMNISDESKVLWLVKLNKNNNNKFTQSMNAVSANKLLSSSCLVEVHLCFNVSVK
jgi:hypothetical protein